MRRRSPIAATAVLLAVVAAIAPPGAQAKDKKERFDKRAFKEHLALCEKFAKAADTDGPDYDWALTDGGMLLAQNAAAKLPAIPALAVEPLVEHLIEQRKEYGPKLKKKGSAYFYDKDKKKGLYIVSKGKKGGGLLISMHGGGEGAGDAGSAHGIWGSATGQGFTVISPEVMKKVSSAWNEEREELMVLMLIDAAKRTFEIDHDKICFAGHSMGGDASWMLGGRNADLLAACSPLAGSVMPYMRPGTKNRMHTPRADYQGLMEGVVPNLMHLQYHIHHSDDDQNEAVHPDDIATGYLKRLQKLFPEKYKFTYDRVTGIQHSLPSTGVKPIIKWLAAQKRVTYPTEVMWETWWSWKRSSYWLYHHDPQRAWRFHGKIVGENHINVTATSKPEQGRKEPKEFELRVLLSPKLVDLEKPIKITSGDKVLFEGTVERSLWALMVTAGRSMDRDNYYEAYADVKVPRQPWFDAWDWEGTK